MALGRPLSPAARRRWRAAGSLAFAAFCFVFLKADNCSKSVTDPAAVITSVTLVPGGTTTVAPGGTAMFEASPYDASNRLIDGRAVTWQTGNPAIATVKASTDYRAVVTGVAVGTTTITSTVDGVSATSTVVVAAPTVSVASVTVAAAANTGMRILDSAYAEATVKDAAGNTLTGRAITWSVADTSVADISASLSGAVYVLAKKLGTTTLTATSGGISGSTSIQVTAGPRPMRVGASVDTVRIAAGAEATVTVSAYDRLGRALPDSAVNVSLANTAVARFAVATTTTTGRTPLRIAGLVAGTTTLGISALFAPTLNVPIIVTAPAAPVATAIAISPKTSQLQAGLTQTFSATVVTNTGGAYTGTVGFRAVGTGASITPAGVLSAAQSGNVLVIASADALADTARVTVFGIDSVRIAPRAPIALTVGGNAALVAKVYGGGRELTGQTVGWASSNTAVVDLTLGTQSAIATAKGAGTATIIAAAGGKADTVAVTVTAAPTGGNTLDIHPLGIFSVKRLADGTTQSFNNMFLAGDHEANGDRSIQAFASYLFTGLPTVANVTRADLTVRLDPQVTGSPFTLGALVVELASSSTLNEGPLATNAVVVATGISPSTVTVNVLPLIRAALAAGQPSALLRFRFTQLGNANGQIDYVGFYADPLTLTY